MAATYPADTFQEGVDLTIEASNQLAQVVRGDANTEVTVADGSTIPSIRKAQADSMYFKEPEAWTTGQTETDYLQLKKYTDPTTNKESWWFAKGALVSNPIAMGTSPFGDDNWTLYTPEDLFISGKAEYESIYQALKGKAAEAGYNLVRGSFEEGGTLTNTNDVLWYQSNGRYYSWKGSLPKVVPAGSTPATSGGIGAGAWVDRTDVHSGVEDRLLGVGAKIYRGSNGQYVQNGDTVPAGTTHLTVMINDKPEDVRMSSFESGLVTDLTETSATIGGTTVSLHRFLNGGYQATNSELAGITLLVGEQWFNTTKNSIHIGDGSTQGGIEHLNMNTGVFQFPSVSEMTDSILSVGSTVRIVERDSGLFVVTLGGTPNGFDILDAGNGNTAVLSKNQKQTARMFGVLPAPSDTTDAIKRIFQYSQDNSIYPTFYAEKYIFNDNSAQVYDRIGIIGTKMPEADTSTKELKNGTIFIGTLNLRVRTFFGSYFGVDRGLLNFPDEVDAGNALKIQSGVPSGAGTVILEYVVGFCREENDPYHAVLCEGYSDVSMKTVRGYYSYFGLALKAIRANIDDLSLFFNGSDNLIVKSDAGFGNCRDININNLICVGSPGKTNYNVRVSSFDAQMQRVNINNYNLAVANNSNIYLDVTGGTGVAINEVNIDNGTMRGAGVNAVLVNGNVYSTTISGRSVEQNGRHLRVIGSAQQVNLNDFFGSLSALSTNINDSIYIDSTTVNTSFNNVTSLVNYSNTNLGGITYNNSAEKNKLGVIKANIFQNNPYEDGLKTETISGAAQTITPIFGENGMTCFLKVKTGGVNAYVSTIVRNLNGTSQRFPAGFRLTVLNDDVATLTMNHNPAGNIFNQSSTAIVLPTNGLITYVFSGALWYSV